MNDKIEKFQFSELSEQELIDHERVDELKQVGIVQCGIANARELFNVYRRNQQKHMLLFTVRGKGWLETPQVRYELEPSSLIVVPAGIENGFGILQETWQFAWLFLTPERDWGDLVRPDVSYQITPVSEVMYSTIHTLLRSRVLPVKQRHQMTHFAVQQMQVLREMPTQSTPSKHRIKLQRVFDLVQRQLHREWDVEQLAALYPCSAPHLHRLCQQYFGHSPMVHLTNMRMDHAAHLLQTTEWPIQGIGEVVGYPISANFSTRFRKFHGVSPRQYRQHN